MNFSFLVKTENDSEVGKTMKESEEVQYNFYFEIRWAYIGMHRFVYEWTASVIEDMEEMPFFSKLEKTFKEIQVG